MKEEYVDSFLGYDPGSYRLFNTVVSDPTSCKVLWNGRNKI
jgi:hypothetical protein